MGPRRNGAGPDLVLHADRRALARRPGNRRASATVAESSGVGRRPSRENRDAAANLAWGWSPSGPRTSAQPSGSARTVRWGTNAARSGRTKTAPSASVPTALTIRRNDKSRCHMVVILAGEHQTSQGAQISG
jgi:hypothetical protein